MLLAQIPQTYQPCRPWLPFYPTVPHKQFPNPLFFRPFIFLYIYTFRVLHLTFQKTKNKIFLNGDKLFWHKIFKHQIFYYNKLTNLPTKNKGFFEDQPKIAILSETNQCNSGVQTLLKLFRYELGAYKVLLHHNPVNQQRSILIMIHRSCPLTLTGTEKIDNNCVKLKMIRNDMSFAFFALTPPVKVKILNSFTK